ncbi:MAG: twitching motility protein PilT [Deltaproteobacteria bacterium RIFOXYD12_FULL_57_12]|nr:MAG: twitching motility protein PilT [Deltaproteobacteria bacterium RIFOXYD12_FULL_57_12]
MSRLLLDTHVFLWWVNDDPNLTAVARQAIADANNECYLSLASCWEMAIKSSLGKLRLAKPVERFVAEQLAANGFTLLNIELRHAAKVEKLPFHHQDPFDRLLIAQAITGKLIMVSADRVFSDYGLTLLW